MGWICLVLWSEGISGQTDSDSIKGILPDWVTRYGKQESLFPLHFSEYTEYSLSASLSSFKNNPGQSEKGRFLLQHSLRVSGSIEKPGKFAFSNLFSHCLGIQCHFDSITVIQQDENVLRTRLEMIFPHDLGLGFDSEISTRLFNGYDYIPGDSNQTIRVLNSAFLTPLVWTLSLGFTWKIPQTGSLMAGISGAKFTYLRDTSVFSTQQTSEFQGVSRGHRTLFEYGFNCRILLDKMFWKIIRWNCDLFLFKAANKPADLSLKNQLEIRPLKFLSLSLQTRLQYDQDISRKIQILNVLSTGLVLKK